MAPKEITVEFEKEKDTPGTVRYTELAEKDAQAVGKLYVKKASAKKLGDPEKLSVTITAG